MSQKNEIKKEKKLSYGRQWIDNRDIREVVRVLRSDWITQGPTVKEFEEKLASYCGATYAVAVSSGTAALHLACKAAGIEEGDEAITSPVTFLATASSIVYCGGKPVFADVEESTITIDPVKVEKALTERTKAIIPVHFAGIPCRMDELAEIAGAASKRLRGGKKIYIIEDAAHAMGAQFRGEKAGSCRFSDMTILSFHPVKHITTGEGGAILTNDRELYEKLLRFRSHGITKAPELLRYGSTEDPWYYELHEPGFNYRITDIQAALGISQLSKLDKFIERRREIASMYDEAFDRIDNISYLKETPERKSSYHIYVLLIDFVALGKKRRDVMKELDALGIGTQVHYVPVHLQPYYRKICGTREGDFPVAEAYYEKALTVPLFPKMSDRDVRRVVAAVKKVLGHL